MAQNQLSKASKNMSKKQVRTDKIDWDEFRKSIVSIETTNEPYVQKPGYTRGPVRMIKDAAKLLGKAGGKIGGKIGGRSRSEAKLAAARENGKNGGRLPHNCAMWHADGLWQVRVYYRSGVALYADAFKGKAQARRKLLEAHRHAKSMNLT